MIIIVCDNHMEWGIFSFSLKLEFRKGDVIENSEITDNSD